MNRKLMALVEKSMDPFKCIPPRKGGLIFFFSSSLPWLFEEKIGLHHSSHHIPIVETLFVGCWMSQLFFCPLCRPSVLHQFLQLAGICVFQCFLIIFSPHWPRNPRNWFASGDGQRATYRCFLIQNLRLSLCDGPIFIDFPISRMKLWCG